MEALREYIERNLKKGYTIPQIKAMLLKAGWSKEDVEASLDDVRPMPLEGEAKRRVPTYTSQSPKPSARDIEIPTPNTMNNSTTMLGVAALICAFVFSPLGLILGIIAVAKKSNMALGIIAIAISLFQMIIFGLVFLPFLFMFNSPPRQISTCRFQGFTCTDHSITKSDITFTLKSDLDYPITLKSATEGKCTGLPSSVVDGKTGLLYSQVMLPGQSVTMILHKCNIIKSWYDNYIMLSYTTTNSSYVSVYGHVAGPVDNYG